MENSICINSELVKCWEYGDFWTEYIGSLISNVSTWVGSLDLLEWLYIVKCWYKFPVVNVICWENGWVLLKCVMEDEFTVTALFRQVRPNAFLSSSPIWLYHYFRGCLPTGSTLCTVKQLGGNPTGCTEVCLWNQTHCGWASRKYWYLVQNPGHVGTPGSHQQCEYSYVHSVSASFASSGLTNWIHYAGLPDCLHIWIPAQTAVPIWVWLEFNGIRQLHACLRPARDYASAMPVPWPERWQGQPHSLLLATAGSKAGLRHCVWGEYNEIMLIWGESRSIICHGGLRKIITWQLCYFPTEIWAL